MKRRKFLASLIACIAAPAAVVKAVFTEKKHVWKCVLGATDRHLIVDNFDGVHPIGIKANYFDIIPNRGMEGVKSFQYEKRINEIVEKAGGEIAFRSNLKKSFNAFPRSS
jgi:hypothetical protein